jgi:2-amino-4-hydroxy-6-hydroxymethyldihydropteridine diphosphokinase
MRAHPEMVREASMPNPKLPANHALLALGANIRGCWGSPPETLARAVCELVSAGMRLIATSRLYWTAPLGGGCQPPYLNGVVLVETRLTPAALLRLVKRLERRAGRRLGVRWGPRCLDIDILDHGGRRLGAGMRKREHGRIVLPHPELHKRAFVLVPLLDVAPSWRHPILQVPARSLLARLAPKARAGIGQALDFKALACDNSEE